MPAHPTHLAPDAEPLDRELLRRAGYATVLHLAEVDSTMNPARRLAEDPDARLPAVVVADRQTAGRGRRGAGWWHAPGSLAASVVVDAAAGAGPQPLWSLACAVALAESLEALAPGLDPRVRWPNDVESGGRKLAGILVETCGPARAIFGVGVNTRSSAAQAPAALARRVATLPDVAGAGLGRAPLLAHLLERLLELVAAERVSAGTIAARYRTRCAVVGTTITVFAGAVEHRGTCAGIADSGSLLLDTPTGRLELAAGSLTAPADVWRPDASPG